MDDPIPAEFITLPEALARIAACVSDVHLASAKPDFQDRVEAIAAMPRDQDQTASATSESCRSEGADNLAVRGPSEQASRHWDQRNFATMKLRLALQAGAISAIVRDPQSGSRFRLAPYDWRQEPFWEQIIRGGVILHASKGFECHHGRTVLIETADFEVWLRAEVTNWPELSREQLCFNWLEREMRASPQDKKKDKAQWLEKAKLRFRVSGRAFESAWSAAVKQTGSNWDRPGAPSKSSQKFPR
jgi:hypothetical protein